VKTTFEATPLYVEIYRFRFHTLEQEHFDISAQYRLGARFKYRVRNMVMLLSPEELVLN
jgi:hypothetical protein